MGKLKYCILLALQCIMHVQGKNLPAIQGTPTINKPSGENNSQLKFLIASTKHSVCSNEIRLKTISISFSYNSYSFSHLTTNSVPLGTFIDIYVWRFTHGYHIGFKFIREQPTLSRPFSINLVATQPRLKPPLTLDVISIQRRHDEPGPENFVALHAQIQAERQ